MPQADIVDTRFDRGAHAAARLCAHNAGGYLGLTPAKSASLPELKAPLPLTAFMIAF